MVFIVAPAPGARNRFSQKIRQIAEWTVFVPDAVDFPVDVRYHLFLQVGKVRISATGGEAMPGGKHVLGQSRDRHIFGTVKVGEKGQIVIPKEARTVFGIQPGDTLLVLGDEVRGIVVTRPEVMRDVAAKIFDESDE
jgi:AbrB family looped-hinge helix DNA binding protein